MTQGDMDAFAPALCVANAVLYEGYLLYPYTASAPKNRIRWQFGVVVPRAYLSAGTGETAEQQTEVLFEPDAAETASVTVRLRFLQVEARRVEALRGDAFELVESLKVDGTAYVRSTKPSSARSPRRSSPPRTRSTWCRSRSTAARPKKRCVTPRAA